MTYQTLETTRPDYLDTHNEAPPQDSGIKS